MSEKKVKISNIAGLCVKGGRKDNFFFCLLEYFEESNRWFLSSTLQFKGELGMDKDDAIQIWLDKYNIDNLIVNFPLSPPACQTCSLTCPGIKLCPDLSVKEVQLQTDKLLKEDADLHSSHPKSYEEKRVLKDQVKLSKEVIKHNSKDTPSLISRSLRRRLKRGFLPYWNRALDFWVWDNYFDLMLNLFKCSFDSFGNTPLIVMSRFSYIKKHLPKKLEVYEANYQLNLIEFYKAGIISKAQIESLKDIHTAYTARLEILKSIEEKLGIFIYEHDLDLIADHPLAFEAFLLGAVGPNILKNELLELPSWTLPSETRFAIPKFS